jgi:hypothetical protein
VLRLFGDQNLEPLRLQKTSAENAKKRQVCLFLAQRFDRFQHGRAARWIKSRRHPRDSERYDR